MAGAVQLTVFTSIRNGFPNSVQANAGNRDLFLEVGRLVYT